MQATMLLSISMITLLVLVNTATIQCTGQNWVLVDNTDSKRTYFLLPLNYIGNEEKQPDQDVWETKDRNDNNPNKKPESVLEKDEDRTDVKYISYSNNGFRKQQWHNYPRQLDRLERSMQDLNNFKVKKSDDTRNDVDYNWTNINQEDQPDVSSIESHDEKTNFNNDLKTKENYVVNDLTPILILRIRLLILSWKNRLSQKEKRIDVQETPIYDGDTEETAAGQETIGDIFSGHPVMGSTLPMLFDPEINTIYVTRGRLPSSHINNEYPLYATARQARARTQKRASPDELRVSKRIFSFWSRLQGMTHSGRDLDHRRHFHAFGGYPAFDSNGDIVSAETRALVRPPGSPLRWG